MNFKIFLILFSILFTSVQTEEDWFNDNYLRLNCQKTVTKKRQCITYKWTFPNCTPWSVENCSVVSYKHNSFCEAFNCEVKIYFYILYFIKKKYFYVCIVYSGAPYNAKKIVFRPNFVKGYIALCKPLEKTVSHYNAFFDHVKRYTVL